MAQSSSSKSTLLTIAAIVFGTVFIGFGINAILRPEAALTPFELEYPLLPSSRRLVDALMMVYGARDIFMGLSIYASAYFGTRDALGWITLAASGVAAADGAICKFVVGKGEMNHWGYAPFVAITGAMLLAGVSGHQSLEIQRKEK